MLVRRRNPQGDRAGVIDSLILTVGIALLSWVFLVAPNIHLSGLTLLEKAVSAAYPLGDILLLAAAIRLAVDKGKRAPAFYLLVGSIVSLLAVDSAYTYALAHGRVQPPADLRRGLDRLLPALGRGRAPSLDAHARGACARVPRAPHATPSRAARGSLSDRARRPVLPGARRPRRARADRGVGDAVPPRRGPDGRPGAPGGASGSTRAGVCAGGRRARRGRRSRAGQRGRHLGGPGSRRRTGDSPSRPVGRRARRCCRLVRRRGRMACVERPPTAGCASRARSTQQVSLGEAARGRAGPAPPS